MLPGAIKPFLKGLREKPDRGCNEGALNRTVGWIERIPLYPGKEINAVITLIIEGIGALTQTSS